MQIDISTYINTQFSNFLLDIPSIGEQDIESIDDVATQFPYCQTLHFLKAKAAVGTANYEDLLEKVAIYATSRAVLYDFITDSSEVSSFEPRATGDELLGDKLTDVTEEIVNDPLSIEPLATGDGLSGDNEPLGFEPRATGDELSGDKLTNVTEEIANEPLSIEPLATGDGLSGDKLTEVTKKEYLSFEPRATGNELLGDKLKDVSEACSSQPESPWLAADFPQIETYDHHDSVLIKEIEENEILVIAQSPQPEKSQPESPWLESQQSAAQKPESNPSLYNDDKLPFTFLWWLNKTRKEHYENNQPYVEPKVNASSLRPETVNNPMLNQQIAENILQHKVLDNYILGNNTPEPVTKEDLIIKKFIIEEPQIKHLPASKLDTENKAKASSADLGELVSETLAKIYVEQMLYAKALETYKKLSLKYPEKSSYFASHIKYLELKVN